MSSIITDVNSHNKIVETIQSAACAAVAVAGHPIVENCLAGYNSSIFAYGQTGAGKTYTMIGQLGRSDQVSPPASSYGFYQGFRAWPYIYKQSSRCKHRPSAIPQAITTIVAGITITIIIIITIVVAIACNDQEHDCQASLFVGHLWKMSAGMVT